MDSLRLWSTLKRVSKKQIQRLCGKLNWAARVIRGGRTYLRRLINLYAKLKDDKHRTWICKDARDDIRWWNFALPVFNGTAKFVCDILPPNVALHTDACQRGGGGEYLGQMFYSNFEADAPLIVNSHISCKELFTILLACRKWAHLWSNEHIVMFCDNSPSVYAINNGTSKNSFFMKCIREIHWLGVRYNFRVTARHIPGVENVLCDALSRLHDPYYFSLAAKLLRYCQPILARNLMSFNSFVCLQDCILACKAF